MSMLHKAYIFDFESFDRELKPLLESALRSQDGGALVDFVSSSIGCLVDPYEGEPLTKDWLNMVEVQDIHQIGDFAITKYYNPKDDIGLGDGWESIQELLPADVRFEISPILGSPVGSEQGVFDPGKMGSYFQSRDQVNASLDLLGRMHTRSTRSKVMSDAIEMIRKAKTAASGLYVTF